ncbi:hypothetical protein ACL6C3_14555 [Capilliphycus salinus ALCB114379]|uniref:hypothetical protein n=1 Tax=Capilliphycus salinus TaxID=2768948 RepID=UPI0039A557A9
MVLITQYISRVSLPNDGQVVTVQSSNPSNGQTLNDPNIFWLNGVVSLFEERTISQELAARFYHPVQLIRNGSLCQADDGNCYKEVDYIKAFVNRFGNQLIGRGNESIIEATKEVLRKNLSGNLSKIQLVTYSEGGLIAHAAVGDLYREGNPHLSKITVILMGTPLHHKKITELEAMVGKVLILNNPRDPVTCFQNDILAWSSWFGEHPHVKQCLINSDVRQHTIELYMEKLVSMSWYFRVCQYPELGFSQIC